MKKMKQIMILTIIMLLIIMTFAFNMLIVYAADDFLIDENGCVYEYTGADEHILIPDKVGDVEITGLTSDVFNGNTTIKSVTLSSGIKQIPSYCFSGCKNLESINFNGEITEIGTRVFMNCTSLKVITIPKTVRSSTGHWFIGCTSLEKVIFEDGAVIIPSYAFANLTHEIQLQIPDSVRTIASGAFENCKWLANTDMIPDTVMTIAGNAFRNCSGIKALNLPKNLRYIGPGAFYGCTEIENVELPENVDRLSKMCFAGCTNLKNITFNDVITTIGDNAFQNCTALKEITIPNTVKSSGSGGNEYGYWFKGCTSLEKVVFEDGTLEIPSYVFANFDHQIEIQIPDSVKTISTGVFENCKWLTDINIIPDTVTTIDNYAFIGCSGITSLTLPTNLTYIGDGAFKGCSGIKSVKLPKNTERICAESFAGCTSLTNITFNEKITAIGNKAFQNCTSLKEITIPKTVTTSGTGSNIYGRWFTGCTALKNVTIEDGATQIHINAFADLASEINLYCPSTVTAVNTDAFANSMEKVTIYCEKGSFIEEYAKNNGIKVEILVTVDTFTLNIVDTKGAPVSNASVYLYPGTEDAVVYTTDNQGVLVLEDVSGTIPVGVYKKGYTPITCEIEMTSGGKKEIKIEKKDFVIGSLDSRRLTLDEIKNAGYDTASNYWHIKFEITLIYGKLPQGKAETIEFDAKEYEIKKYEAEDGSIVLAQFEFPRNEKGEIISDEPNLYIITLTGDVHWLKDIFSVDFTVINCAKGDINLNDVLCTLKLPEGLTLLSGNSTQSTEQISAADSHQFSWDVRGDIEGAYGVEITTAYTLMPFGINSVMTTKSAENLIQVRGCNGLDFEFQVENKILNGRNLRFMVTLKNVTDSPIYMPGLSFDFPAIELGSFKEGEDGDMTTLNPDEALLYLYEVDPREYFPPDYTVLDLMNYYSEILMGSQNFKIRIKPVPIHAFDYYEYYQNIDFDNDDIKVNGSGYGYAYYKMRNTRLKELKNQEFKYEIVGYPEYSGLTKSNEYGVVSIRLPEVKENTEFTIKFSNPDGSKSNLETTEGKAAIQVNRFEYSNELVFGMGAQTELGKSTLTPEVGGDFSFILASKSGHTNEFSIGKRIGVTLGLNVGLNNFLPDDLSDKIEVTIAGVEGKGFFETRKVIPTDNIEDISNDEMFFETVHSFFRAVYEDPQKSDFKMSSVYDTFKWGTKTKFTALNPIGGAVSIGRSWEDFNNSTGKHRSDLVATSELDLFPALLNAIRNPADPIGELRNTVVELNAFEDVKGKELRVIARTTPFDISVKKKWSIDIGNNEKLSIALKPLKSTRGTSYKAYLDDDTCDKLIARNDSFDELFHDASKKFGYLEMGKMVEQSLDSDIDGEYIKTEERVLYLGVESLLDIEGTFTASTEVENGIIENRNNFIRGVSTMYETVYDDHIERDVQKYSALIGKVCRLTFESFIRKDVEPGDTITVENLEVKNTGDGQAIIITEPISAAPAKATNFVSDENNKIINVIGKPILVEFENEYAEKSLDLIIDCQISQEDIDNADIYYRNDELNTYVACNSVYENGKFVTTVDKSGYYVLMSMPKYTIEKFNVTSQNDKIVVNALAPRSCEINEFSLMIGDREVVSKAQLDEYYSYANGEFNYTSDSIQNGEYVVKLIVDDVVVEKNIVVDNTPPKFESIEIASESTDIEGIKIKAEVNAEKVIAYCSIDNSENFSGETVFELEYVDGKWECEAPYISGLTHSDIILIAQDDDGDYAISNAYMTNYVSQFDMRDVYVANANGNDLYIRNQTDEAIDIELITVVDNKYKKTIPYRVEPGISYTNVEKNKGESIYIWQSLKNLKPWCKAVEFDAFDIDATK